MIIRTATIGDAEEIAKILKESYNIDSIEEGLKVYYSERKKGHRYIVACDDECDIVGLTTWLPHGLPKHMLAELDRIAVLPKCRGKGVARQLFDKLKEDANNWYQEQGFRLRKLYLLTHENNERAQAFYKKLGLEHETTLKQHYYEDKDEYVFSMFFD